MKSRYQIFWVFLFLSFTLKAQKSELSNDPLVFGQEMSQLLQDRGTPQLGLDFEQVWNSKLSSDHKKKLTQSFLLMSEKGFKLDPHLQRTVSLIVKASDHQDLNATVFNNFVSTLHSAVEQLKNKEILAFLETTDLILEKRTFYYSSYNSLLLEGGTIDFEFYQVSAMDPESDEPIPDILS